MKIQVASDLHLELLASRFPGYRPVERTDADVLVLAGDIHQQDRAVDAFADWPVPVVLLNGNHEFYGSSPGAVVAGLETASARVPNVHYLENRVWTHSGVRFLGCCLWTDYDLYGAREAAMAAAGRILMDHRRIRHDDHFPFTPQHALELHWTAADWLSAQLAMPFEGKTVVCTHHGPSAHSTHADYADDTLNPCFISNLDRLVEKADLWIHGHVHNSFDYRVGRCRVVVNPRGYALNLNTAPCVDGVIWENPRFDPALMVEI
jgi:predicted phosphodiesterase